MQVSEMDAHILRRAFAKQDVSHLTPENELLTLVLNQPYDVLNDLTTSDDELVLQVMKADVDNPPEAKPNSSDDVVYIPPLPDSARLPDDSIKASEHVGTWFKTTSAWAKEQSPMTPPHFLEAATLWLAGLVIARRVAIHLHERIYPHLYLLIVAETSRFAKSTGMNIFYHIISELMPYMLIPGTATTEGMIELLSGQQPANFDKLPQTQQEMIRKGMAYAGQRGIILDEYSSLLASGKKDYMQGFVELLMRLYDAREAEHHYTKSAGWLTIRRPAISIFGATTPAAMARAVNNESWQNGEMARYFIMFREDVLPYRSTWGKSDIPDEIKKPVLRVHRNLPEMQDQYNQPTDNQPIYAQFENKETFDLYERYTRAMRYDIQEDTPEFLWGNYTRLPIQALKIALSLATFDSIDAIKDGDKCVKITKGHWAIAQDLIERSRHNIHNLIHHINESKDAKIQRDLLSLLKQNPGGLTVRDMCRRTHSAAKDIRYSLDILIEGGDILEIEHKPEFGGRPTKFYKLP